jgi:hypothetical protein
MGAMSIHLKKFDVNIRKKASHNLPHALNVIAAAMLTELCADKLPINRRVR